MVGLPIRLVRRDGIEIPLDCTDYMIQVNRNLMVQPIPLTGERFGGDLNIVASSIRLNVILKDDDCGSVAAPARYASAFIDFSSAEPEFAISRQTEVISGLGERWLTGDAPLSADGGGRVTLTELDNAVITVIAKGDNGQEVPVTVTLLAGSGDSDGPTNTADISVAIYSTGIDTDSSGTNDAITSSALVHLLHTRMNANTSAAWGLLTVTKTTSTNDSSTPNATGVLVNNPSGYSANTSSTITVDTVDATTKFAIGDGLYDDTGTLVGAITNLTATVITLAANNATVLDNNENLRSGEKSLLVFVNDNSGVWDENTVISPTVQMGGAAKQPRVSNFSGGGAADCFSAGDKVQNLLGTVVNNTILGGMGGLFNDTLNVGDVDLLPGSSDSNVEKDYIIGLQLPYNSFNNVDTTAVVGEQPEGYSARNFMYKTGFGVASGKGAASNLQPASVEFSPRNKVTGIRGTVTAVEFDYKAGETIYNATVTFQPLDLIAGL